jgi:hypothetical protein
VRSLKLLYISTKFAGIQIPSRLVIIVGLTIKTSISQNNLLLLFKAKSFVTLIYIRNICVRLGNVKIDLTEVIFKFVDWTELAYVVLKLLYSVNMVKLVL